ncbi:AraC family transcriptional regulator [Xanthomonas campestris pv. pennamericanum]|uniref:AraC family transcriptional regulator n=1 Tax=Xanthomonas euvesicatoria TaxID=456327 RepID=UPI001C472626|nr:AraC family transcriptional regulator [Xanthomonas euvesicatoria]MBV6808691.1 AraC family transcriptional regulator [Xanthomonas campestris pv. pennamericanum]
MDYACAAMISSQSSKDDPLSQVLAELGARSAGLNRLEARGDWALSFPEKHRLKLVAAIRGECWIRLPRRAPKRVVEGDVLLIGNTPYVVAGDPQCVPVDGVSRYAGQESLHLGDGDDTVLLGAGILFSGENSGFLIDALPRLMKIQSVSPSAFAVRATLDLLDAEMGRHRMGSARVASCLSEVLVVEAIRAYMHAHKQTQAQAHISWIGALGDRHIGAALALMHGDVAHAWTVAELASRVGMSRSAFSSRFSQTVGQAPLHYLTQWRMLLAHRLLAETGLDIAHVAERVGYQSPSAFGHAFKRMFGAAPRRLVRPGER